MNSSIYYILVTYFLLFSSCTCFCLHIDVYIILILAKRCLFKCVTNRLVSDSVRMFQSTHNLVIGRTNKCRSQIYTKIEPCYVLEQHVD